MTTQELLDRIEETEFYRKNALIDVEDATASLAKCQRIYDGVRRRALELQEQWARRMEQERESDT